MHVHTCTVRRRFVSVTDLLEDGCGAGSLSRYLGAEAQAHASIGGTFGDYTSLFASMHGELLLGGGDQMGSERRLVVRAGAAFHTTHGDWTVFGEGWFGNEVGLFRERQGASVGGGLRYTPPFSD